MFTIPSLKFPQLIHIGSTKFSGQRNSQKETSLYRLDWSYRDEILKKNDDRWRDGTSKRLSDFHPFIITLPGIWESRLQSMKFAITDKYMQEIKRCVDLGAKEWDIRRPFDTDVREMCLIPAKAFIEVAFKLLVDCLYDSEDHYYDRTPLRRIGKHMLIYRFWHHQTGGGLLKSNAEIDKLEKMLLDNDRYVRMWDKEHFEWATRFVSDINNQESAMEPIPDGVPETGPSLGLDGLPEKGDANPGLPEGEAGLPIIENTIPMPRVKPPKKD